MEQFLHYLTLPYLLTGCLVALELLVCTMVAGLIFGFFLALGQDSARWWIRLPIKAYIYIIRGTPLLLTLILIYTVLPQFGIVLSTFESALIGLSLNEIAFCSEFIRGGINSVSRDQRTAAVAFGFSRRAEMIHVVLPQAFRAIIPTIGNETVGTLKSTALASVVGVNELTLRSQTIFSQNFEFLPVLAASGTMYIVMSTLIAWGQVALENRFSLTARAARSARKAKASPLVADPALARAAAPSPPEASSEIALAFDNVHINYGGTEVIKGIDLSIRAGEVVALLGRSGSGKSTLLKSVVALTSPSEGSILINGKRVGYGAGGRRLSNRALAQARAAARVGIVFQNFALFDHLTALENAMSVPRLVQKSPGKVAEARASAALNRVGLGAFMSRLPHELSGGQQQRVAIARALAAEPKLLLFDEPTSALDPELVGEVNRTIRALAHTGITMLLSTHDIAFAALVADRVVFLHQGKIAEEGPASIIQNPRTEEFAAFLRLTGFEGEAKREEAVLSPVS